MSGILTAGETNWFQGEFFIANNKNESAMFRSFSQQIECVSKHEAITKHNSLHDSTAAGHPTN
jgi:hypothetical protein